MSPETNRYLALLAALEGEDNYAAATASSNRFAAMAKKIPDPELEVLLRSVHTKDAAITAVLESMREKNISAPESRQSALMPATVPAAATDKPPPAPQRFTFVLAPDTLSFRPSDDGSAPSEPAGSPQAVLATTPVVVAKMQTLAFESVEGLVQFADLLMAGSHSPNELRDEMRVLQPAPDHSTALRIRADRLTPHFKNNLRLLKGREDDSVDGAWFKMNAFLQNVKLRAWRSQPSKLDALIVQIPSQKYLEASQIFDKFPKCSYMASSFLFDSSKSAGNPETFILFENIQNLQNVYTFVDYLRDTPVKLFYPVSGSSKDSSARYFVQWGRVHPVASMPRLYNPGGNRYVLMADRWINIPAEAARDGIRRANQVFTVNTRRAFTESRERDVAADAAPPPLAVSLKAIRPKDFQLNHSVALARRLETERGILADLEAKYELIQRMVLGQCRIALAFNDDGPGGQLPERLRNFLHAPYRSLGKYEYCYLRDARGEKKLNKHVVFSVYPMLLAEAVVCGANAIYAQDTRWPGLSVPMFLRSGVDFLPRIDDPAMADALREFLRVPPGESFKYALVDKDDDNLTAIGVTETKPLAELIGYFNTHYQGLTRVETAFPFATADSAETVSIELARELEELQAKLADEVNLQVQSALKQWEELHKAALTTLAKIRESAEDFTRIDGVLNAAAKPWETFALTVMSLHEDLSKRKVSAMKGLASDSNSIAKRKAEAEKAHANAEALATEATKKVGEASVALAAEESKTRQAFEAATKSFDAFKSKREQLEADIDDKKAVYDAALDDARKAEAQLKAKWERLRAEKQELDELAAKNEERAGTNHRLEAENRTLEAENMAMTQELMRREMELAEERRRLIEAQDSLEGDPGVFRRAWRFIFGRKRR